jgi:hypothetical protein
VQHHLLDGHDVLAVRRELGHVLDDLLLGRQQAVADAHPHHRRHDRLRRREEAEALLVRRRAERLEREHLPVAGDRQLAGRRDLVVHQLLRAPTELVESHGAGASRPAASAVNRRVRTPGAGA